MSDSRLLKLFSNQPNKVISSIRLFFNQSNEVISSVGLLCTFQNVLPRQPKFTIGKYFIRSHPNFGGISSLFHCKLKIIHYDAGGSREISFFRLQIKKYQSSRYLFAMLRAENRW